MKIKMEIDPSCDEPEIVLKAPEITEEVEAVYKQLLGRQNKILQLEVEKDNVSYYLKLSEILFFETDSKLVMAHTKNEAFKVNYKLYELEEILGANFMRVAKSTIINLDQIYSLTRSISNCEVTFQESYKKVYVSRRYYRAVRTKLDERRRVS
ncbi:LytTR family DNA-binding domain-containing protein [Lactobacillus gigeriorum]|uniref:Response regulator n=2 Tax=Lactobacillus gigeriorum DSM 23908 = CRBIP 24.85 TaxID=1423751 RepID=I7KQL6_9LACO|nr:LytTR family DNA-binding domain-containing protein [Lactobacillus gigeriorum]CCI87969.1 Response regulator [Lactobacillus gigeriorum DSM 23908 = CRBIP 24.85]